MERKNNYSTIVGLLAEKIGVYRAAEIRFSKDPITGYTEPYGTDVEPDNCLIRRMYIIWAWNKRIHIWKEPTQ